MRNRCQGYSKTKFRYFGVEKHSFFSLDNGSAEQPTKTEDTDLLEGAGEGLLEALVGVGAGTRQLAGQVIGQAVVEKTDEPDPEPAPGQRIITRATKSLHQILAERRRRDDEQEMIKEQEEPETRGVAPQALDRYEKEMAAAQLSRKCIEEGRGEQEAKRLK